MSQTSIIAGALIIAYIVFVTVRGELPAYLAMLGVGGSSAVTPSGCATSTGGTSGTGGTGGGLSFQTPPISIGIPSDGSTPV